MLLLLMMLLMLLFLLLFLLYGKQKAERETKTSLCVLEGRIVSFAVLYKSYFVLPCK